MAVAASSSSIGSTNLGAGAPRGRGQGSRAFGVGLGGEAALVCRYLAAQAPPPGCDTVAKCAHFVSLLPPLEGPRGPFGEELWCTSQQCLDMVGAGGAERAFLLANFLLHLGERARDGHEVYAVLGSAVPDGDAAYVLRVPPGGAGAVLWDAAAGRGYSASDPRCPLRDVHVVASSANAFANLQPPLHPSALALDVRDARRWRPFYADAFPRPSPPPPPVQEPRLRYAPPDAALAADLEAEVREALRRAVRRWRAGFRGAVTSFNADAGSRLRGLLPGLEARKRGEGGGSEAAHAEELGAIGRSRDVSGLPLQMRFTDVAAVVERVRGTAVHMNAHPDVVFALAAGIFPYANNVLSVWVYFVAMVPRYA